MMISRTTHRKSRPFSFLFSVLGLIIGVGSGPLLHAASAAPEAWLRFNQPENQSYTGVPYHFLGDSPLYLTIDVPPASAHVLDLLWGAKNDQRAAVLLVNDREIPVQDGGYDGFRWRRVPLPDLVGHKNYRIGLKPGQPKAAFLAAIRLTNATSAPDAALPSGDAHGIQITAPPPTDLEKWAEALQDPSLTIAQRAKRHGLQSNEALRRCRKYIDGWLAHADPQTGLIPRNLNESKFFWNGRDAGADNYAFMVLTAALTDRPLFEGRMLDMLRTEAKVATRMGALPADYDFNKQSYRFDQPDLNRLIFDGSEYVKDGLMPITEWLGATPWSRRLINIVDDIVRQASFQTDGGPIPSNNVEVNGEMMQVLSRLRFMTGSETYLDMACRIADDYLLGDHHPTRHSTNLGLRDHNCELISGLTEVYAACHFVRKDKAEAYQKPLRDMLDDILKYGINEHGLMFQTINPRTGDVLNKTIHDNWGYNYNGFYTVYLLDGVERYREATRFALSNLKDHYWKFQWQGWGSDGIADSVEGAINLFNREPDVAGVSEWIDANINRMLDIQKPDGVIEGWHGDGNYARTAILWALWKQQGVTLSPWRVDVTLGAVRQSDELHLVLTAEKDWQGRLVFDAPRHKQHMKLPLDYPRINQFPEWFTVAPLDAWTVSINKGAFQPHAGRELLEGLSLTLKAGDEKHLVVRREAKR